MRKINRIFVHCSGGNLKSKPKDLIDWQTKAKSKGGKGWSVGGYHLMIDYLGQRHTIYSFEQITNGVKGYNNDSIHVCMIGGMDEANFTNEQWCELENTLRWLHELYPQAEILGHRDISPDRNRNGRIDPDEWIKLCPAFDVKSWLESINFYA
jgi:N-acetylmuramoyl-L-alanine amidase